MSKGSPILEEALKRIRTGERPAGSKKRRATSKVLLVIDALLIVIILFFFYDKDPEKFYKSSSFNYKNSAVRFSLTREDMTDDYMLSLTIQSQSREDMTLNFNESVGKIELKSGDTPVLTEHIGEETTLLKLKADESRSFARIIPAGQIDQFASGHNDLVRSRKKSLIHFGTEHLPLTAVLTLNTENPVSISLDFKHGVKK